MGVFIFELQRFADMYVNNTLDNIQITGTAGDDSIYNHNGSNVTIDAGAGNDSIHNQYNSSNV